MFNLEFILEGNVITIQIDGNEPMKKATEKFFIITNSEIVHTLFLASIIVLLLLYKLFTLFLFSFVSYKNVLSLFLIILALELVW